MLNLVNTILDFDVQLFFCVSSFNCTAMTPLGTSSRSSPSRPHKASRTDRKRPRPFPGESSTPPKGLTIEGDPDMYVPEATLAAPAVALLVVAAATTLAEAANEGGGGDAGHAPRSRTWLQASTPQIQCHQRDSTARRL